MHVDLANYESIIATLALILITVFSLAAFMDYRWRKTDPPPAFRSGHNRNIRPERDGGDDNDRTSNLYLRYADLSARSLGAAERQIRVHGQTHQNLEED